MKNKETGPSLFPLQEDKILTDAPRLNQCYICKAWALEKDLISIEVPDQAGYIQKLACKKCLDEIMSKENRQDEPEGSENKK